MGFTSKAAAALGALSIAVSGNHFVNGSGQTVRLLGVDRPGTEYACEGGWGYSDGAEDAADAATIAAWHVNAVRIPLNEDCWLGINSPSSDPFYGSAAGYQQAIAAYVSDLNADGIYAILDLHWTAPGALIADGQRPMADQHSLGFWSSVAGVFKDNPAVLFDAFNEPYSPAADFSDMSAYPLTWSCWLNGGCSLPDAADGTDPGSNPATYIAVGMQAIVTAIREAGATQPILLGGLSYANDLSGWLAHEPIDPDDQLAASLHTYEGETCSSTSCWNSQVAPVAAQVPIVAGEFDENPCAPSSDGFDDSFMNWADAAGVSYLAWGWFVGATPDCNNYYLIDADGNAVAPNGTLLRQHLATVSAVSPGPGSASPSPPASQTAPASAATAPMASSGSPTTGAAAPATTASAAQPAPGATVARPSALKPCVVPRLDGDSLTRARQRLRSSHCELGRVSGYARGRSGWRVAAQRPRAGHRGSNGAMVAVSLRRPQHRTRADLRQSPGHGITIDRLMWPS
jgi:endoglucanase